MFILPFLTFLESDGGNRLHILELHIFNSEAVDAVLESREGIACSSLRPMELSQMDALHDIPQVHYFAIKSNTYQVQTFTNTMHIEHIYA